VKARELLLDLDNALEEYRPPVLVVVAVYQPRQRPKLLR
jgi:hypothetical protein